MTGREFLFWLDGVVIGVGLVFVFSGLAGLWADHLDGPRKS